MVKMLLQVVRPYPDNCVSTGFHVCILGAIQFYTLLLSCIQFRKDGKIAMPVVSIKLNDGIQARDKGINTELVPYQVLRKIINLQLSEQVITDSFNVVRRHALLFSIQDYKHLVSFRVGITAWDRAIGDVICLASRWRPAKLFTAYFACVCCLIAACPFIGMFFTAEEINLSIFKTVFRDIYILAAYLTLACFTGLTLWPIGIAVTLQRAIMLLRFHVGSNYLAAGSARNGAYLITKRAFHSYPPELIIPELTAIVKGIEVIAW